MGGYDLASGSLSLETAGLAGLINVLITLALSIFVTHVVLGIGVIVWTGADINELNWVDMRGRFPRWWVSLLRSSCCTRWPVVHESKTELRPLSRWNP